MDTSTVMGFYLFELFSVFWFWKWFGFIRKYKAIRSKGKSVYFSIYNWRARVDIYFILGMATGPYLILFGLLILIDFNFPIVTLITLICSFLLYRCKQCITTHD